LQKGVAVFETDHVAGLMNPHQMKFRKKSHPIDSPKDQKTRYREFRIGRVQVL
jgi:hypothetical protein